MATAALLLLLCSVAIRCSQGAEFAPVGCFVDNTGGVRDLNGLAGLSQIGPYTVTAAEKGVLGLNNLTLQLCSSICAFGSFSYFGVQYARECFCGNSYGSLGTASASDCNMACAGNAGQICGAGGRNSVYRRIWQGAEFAPVGCYVDNPDIGVKTRDLNGLAGMSQIGPYAVSTAEFGVLGLNNLTLQLCSSICAFGSFSYFGVQFARECYCGNSYGSLGTASPSDCNMACAGNASQICGSASRNSVYRQAYFSSRSTFGTEFIAGSRIYLNATSSSGSFSRSLPDARDPVECLIRCLADCQAVLFHQGVCHLLKLPALSLELADFPGEFFVRR